MWSALIYMVGAGCVICPQCACVVCLPYCRQKRASYSRLKYLSLSTESLNMAAEDGQPEAGTQSPPPIFTQEQQQWIEQLISSRTQGQAGTSTGETTVAEIDGTAGGTASGRAEGIPIPTLPLPSGSTAPNPGNLGERAKKYLVAA